MLLLLICFAVVVISFFCMITAFEHYLYFLGFISALVLIASFIMIVLMVFLAVTSNCMSYGILAEKKAEYYSLMHQIENGMYDEGDGTGKFELFKAVTEWNKEVSIGKALQNNIWIGAFWPNIYNELELIDLNTYGSKGDLKNEDN